MRAPPLGFARTFMDAPHVGQNVICEFTDNLVEKSKYEKFIF